MEFPAARLLVFAKAPVPGRVKTRLIKACGRHGAALLYQSLLRQTLSQAARSRLCEVELWCAPDTRHRFFASSRRRHGVSLRTQRGADLGWRMHRALKTALRHSSYAVLIGGDCPAFGAPEWRRALAALAKGWDAVLVPAADGGYVLIGLRRPCATLFQGVRWGGANVLAATRQRLRRAGLRWLELPPAWDVDRPADVLRWKRRRRLEAQSGATWATACSSPMASSSAPS